MMARTYAKRAVAYPDRRESTRRNQKGISCNSNVGDKRR